MYPSDLSARNTGEDYHHAAAALSWVRRSIEVTGGCGSAHSYSPLLGWAKAYPETTGYLIPTLLRYADLLHDESLYALALQCRNWLLGIQLPSGAWAGGLAGETRPSVFNTAMILRGISPSEKSAGDAVAWLLAGLSPDGAWRKDAYVPGFVPGYYTYAVWSVLEVGAAQNRPGLQEKMRVALHFYAGRFQPDGTVLDWGLKPAVGRSPTRLATRCRDFWKAHGCSENKISWKKPSTRPKACSPNTGAPGTLPGGTERTGRATTRSPARPGMRS
jgi:hypothetical protein